MHSSNLRLHNQGAPQEGTPCSDNALLSEDSMPSYQSLPVNASRVAALRYVSRELSQPHINAVIAPSERPPLRVLSEEAQRSLLTHPISLYTPSIQPDSPELLLETLKAALFPQVNNFSPQDIAFLKTLREEALYIERILREQTGNDVNFYITSELGVDRGWHCDMAVAATFKLFGPTTEFLATDSVELELSSPSLLIDEQAPIFYPKEHEILFHYGFPAHEENEANFVKPPLIHRVAEREWNSPLHERYKVRNPHSITVVASSLL